MNLTEPKWGSCKSYYQMLPDGRIEPIKKENPQDNQGGLWGDYEVVGSFEKGSTEGIKWEYMTKNGKIEEILEERNKSHGNYKLQAKLANNLRAVMVEMSENWVSLSPTQKDALLMIVHKISRVLSGDPNHLDSWQDISGYATLVVQDLEGKL